MFILLILALQECRAGTLPDKSGFVGLAGLDAPVSFAVDRFEDCRAANDEEYVRVVKPRKKLPAEPPLVPSTLRSEATSKEAPFALSLSAAASNPKLTVKFGPPKGRKVQPQLNSPLHDTELTSANVSAQVPTSDSPPPAPPLHGPSPPISRAVTPDPNTALNNAHCHNTPVIT